MYVFPVCLSRCPDLFLYMSSILLPVFFCPYLVFMFQYASLSVTGLSERGNELREGGEERREGERGWEGGKVERERERGKEGGRQAGGQRSGE